MRKILTWSILISIGIAIYLPLLGQNDANNYNIQNFENSIFFDKQLSYFNQDNLAVNSKKPKIHFTNPNKAFILTSDRNIKISVCIVSPKDKPRVQLFINNKEVEKRGINPENDKNSCDASIRHQLNLYNYGTYTIKVVATNSIGKTVETRIVRVVQKPKSEISYQPPKAHLLAIGINDYISWKPLSTPTNDTDTLISILTRNYQFSSKNIHKIYNHEATRENILDKIYRLSQEIPVGDDLLIYYAGHGHYNPDNQEGYWIPVDASISHYSGSFISYKELANLLCTFKCKNVYLLNDACYSGSLVRETSGNLPIEEINKYVENVKQYDSKRIFSSGGIEEVDSKDLDALNHSPFANSLFEVLRDYNYQLLPTTILENYITIKVASKTSQRPLGGYVWNCSKQKNTNKGEFIFYKKKILIPNTKIKKKEFEQHIKLYVISSQSQQPLEGVEIDLSNCNLGKYITNKDGKYIFRTKEKLSCKVVFSKENYISKSIYLNNNSNSLKTRNIEISLVEEFIFNKKQFMIPDEFPSEVYSVQLGIFRNFQIKELHRLKEFGNIYRTPIGDFQKYMLGSYETKAEAEVVKEEIIKKTGMYKNAIIIKETSQDVITTTFNKREKKLNISEGIATQQDIYKIQLGVYSRPEFFEYKKYEDLGKIETIKKTVNGKILTIFLLGDYQTKKQAEKIKAEVKKRGSSNVFIKHYNNGKIGH